MEMDLIVTPEKQRNRHAVRLVKTPVRRKLIADDDDHEIGTEKKGQSRTAGGGLRQFSVMVCQKLEAKKITTYKEVADEIISDFATIKHNAEKPLNENEYNEKNIRRRVYDALNVFMALDIIARDKKEIRWKGLPIICKKDVEEVKRDRNKLMNSVQKKAVFLKELREKVSSLESLMLRNQEMAVKTEGPAEGFTLPLILLETNPHAVVEIEISEDMQLVHLDFNSKTELLLLPLHIINLNILLPVLALLLEPQARFAGTQDPADGETDDYLPYSSRKKKKNK
ncbi:hypothetical protein DY000_02000080 [Brassica cretica]|uniref:E2F/DP family winged-helix DNA-binding domain-containing protein n=1 Tax=Brassica cretica TaxID=69181 RepID=A0ABQ7CIU9_BRACR|nr:hypothetical protein DY000_02000080 [Brassica cretica]